MRNPILKYDSDKIYTFGFISLLIRLIVNFSNILQVNGIVDMALLVVFVICMLFVLIEEMLTEVQLFAVIAIGAVCLFSYNKMNNYYLLATYFCMAASKNINLKYVLDYSFKVKTFLLSFHVIVYIFTLINDPSSIKYVYRDGVLRHSLFMSHANTFSMFLIWTIFEYLYVNYERLTLRSLIIIAAINTVLNYFTSSVTNTILWFLVMIAVLINKLYPTWRMDSLRWFVKYGFAILSAFFSLITVFYRRLSGPFIIFYDWLNDFFTGRLIYGAYMFEKFGATFFGQTLKLPKNDYWNGRWFNGIACDNSYLWHLVSFGTLYLILLSLLFFVVANKASKKDTIFLAAYILYGITEMYVTNAVLCFPLIILAQYMFQLNNIDNFQLKIKIRNRNKHFEEGNRES